MPLLRHGLPRMTSSSRKKTLVLAGLLALAGVTVVSVALRLRSADHSAHHVAPEANHDPSPLAAWQPSDDARDIIVGVDATRGPVLHFDNGEPLTLTPSVRAPSDFTIEWSSWETLRGDDHTLVVGSGLAGKAVLKATWTFTHGNPQAHLSLHLRGIPARRLADDIRFASTHHGGEVTLTPALPVSPAGVAVPATWTSGERRLTYTNFNGPRVAVSDSPAAVEFTLWQKGGSRGAIDWSDCIEAPAELVVDMQLELTVTVGGDAAVTRWPIAQGHDALLVPVFDVTAVHPDPELRRAAAEDADRWLWRARTLLYGHSALDDPRYGTGGLLGHGLGGTLVVPEKFAEDQAIRKLAAKLEGTRIELAPRSMSMTGYDNSTRLVASASCQELIELSRAGVPAVITGTPDKTTKSQIAFDPGAGGLAATVGPPLLDGRLTTLIEEGLTPRNLEPLVTQRQTAAFAAPFVATRNPLIGAWKESLLEPERDGHWKVTSALSSALTGLELWREESALLVTSLANATRHTAAMRRTMWWWTEDGKLVVFNPHRAMLQGATFALRQADGQRVVMRLERGIQAIEAGEKKVGRPPLPTVNWKIDTEASAH